jgi:hypothetical protein
VLGLTLLAMGVVVLAVLGALFGLRVPDGVRSVDRSGDARPAATAAADPAQGIAERSPRLAVPPGERRSVAGAAARTLPARAMPRAAAPPSAEPPAREDVPFTIGEPGAQTGMKVFPPMGTKPIKRGIIVPDDFELPPGYVRHYQSTDDGERLPAILMFSPDYDWVDASGHPIALPPDLVVPPELAPPGLAIRLLEPPQAPPDRQP